MENSKIAEFIKNENNVLEVIHAIEETFPEIFMRYNHYERDASSFYYGGHCISFAIILIGIFGEYALGYTSSCCGIIDHAITKIGNNFYDINGNANALYINPKFDPYRDCPDTNYLDYLGEIDTNDNEEHDRDMRGELIEIGKRKVQELMKNLDQEETNHKSM